MERFKKRFDKMSAEPPVIAKSSPPQPAPPPRAPVELPKKKQVVVSVINLKGGVGKTTVTALLADYAVKQGINTLAVDLDPQANLSQALMEQWEYSTFLKKDSPSIVQVFEKGAKASREEHVQSPSAPGWRFQAGVENRGLLIPSRFDFADNLIKPVENNERALDEFIKKRMRDRQLVLIDCAPTHSILTKAAYHASDHILIPVKTEFFSTIGFPLLRKSFEDFERDNPGRKINVCGVVINIADTKTTAMEKARTEIRLHAANYGWDVFIHEMTYSTGFQKWMIDLGHLGNYKEIFRPIARTFMEKVGLLSECADEIAWERNKAILDRLDREL